MRSWEITDIGLVRKENQDACSTCEIGDYTSGVVAMAWGAPTAVV